MQTQAVEGKHPIEELHRKGISITVNTDNNTVSNTDIFAEYEWILENTNLNVNDLMNMNLNAARNIFASPEIKAELIQKINDYKSKEKNKVK